MPEKRDSDESLKPSDTTRSMREKAKVVSRLCISLLKCLALCKKTQKSIAKSTELCIFPPKSTKMVLLLAQNVNIFPSQIHRNLAKPSSRPFSIEALDILPDFRPRYLREYLIFFALVFFIAMGRFFFLQKHRIREESNKFIFAVSVATL